MSTPRELAWRELPLSGTTLIEASAGTGKTYNIALLYLRLVLERHLGVRQILVTTFTDAASQELKSRIRLRLLDAEYQVSVASAGKSCKSKNPELASYLEACCHRDGREPVLARLRLALAEIDQAPISTIHGFCRRVLTDFPFDTGVPFTLGETVDENALVAECVEDFWRSRFLGSTPDAWDLAFVLPEGPDRLAARVTQLLNAPEARVFLDGTQALRQWWSGFLDQDRKALARTVDDEPAFKRPSSSRFRKALRNLLVAAEQADPGAVPWSLLAEVLQSEKVVNAWKKSNTTPFINRTEIRHLIKAAALFGRVKTRACQEAARAAEGFVRKQLSRHLTARGQTTFSQLIGEVHDRLIEPRGDTLALRLAEAWPAALIDEFQDTDSRQWAIFKRLYADPAATGRALILIGDPKQAIYSFRGGDVHAYLAARQGLSPNRVHSIRRNFRSHPKLLDALNRIYRLAGAAAFAGSNIDYAPVETGDPLKWMSSAADKKPLHLRLLQAQSANVSDRDGPVLEACADDIVRLLGDPTSKIGDRRVEPGHIAVLLDTNRRIQALRELLIARGVPVVGAGKSSVIQTEWAEDVHLLLYALLHSNDEYAVRGALATRMLGVTASRLADLASNPDAWEHDLARFGLWRQLWDRRGILAVIEAIITSEAPRLLAANDGERALTDLRHLGEVLQSAAADCYGPEELYAWFVAARSHGIDDQESSGEMQLRIESEAKRVRLLTVHASKGLEFPVVFVPMAWRCRQGLNDDVRKDIARYHDGAHRLCLDLGTADFATHKQIDKSESLQERLRLLYVALTRAVHACHVYAFRDLRPTSVVNAERGELEVLLGAALFNAPSREDGDIWEALAHAIPTLHIHHGVGQHARYQPVVAAEIARIARVPLPAAQPRYGIYSFTALTQRVSAAAAASTRDADDEIAMGTDSARQVTPDEGPHPELSALNSLKGPRFGDAMHQILETGPGSAPFAGQLNRISSALETEAVQLAPESAAAQLEAVAAMLDRVLAAELAPGLRLGTLPPKARRAEFEFAFVLHEARWGRLHQLLDQHGLGDWWPAADSGSVLRGMMTGFIDLVFGWDGRFHVLDYKSNWLGDRLSGYQDEGLRRSMREHRYGLQALIYSVALHRYLGRRILDYAPSQHLGDCWYLFLRAVGLAPGAGLWRKRFPDALVESLDALFEGSGVSA